MPSKKYEVHPYCLAFPELSDDEFQELREDLKMHGQQEPCWVYDKWLIDGKNRMRALQANRQPVQYEAWSPVSKDSEKIDAEIRDFCISKNLRRRHLTESQRAVVAAKLEDGHHGGDRKNADQDATLHLSRDEAAEQLNVSPRSVATAAKVLEHGAPEIVQAVEHGEVTVSDAAKIVGLSPAAQRQALAKVESGKTTTLAQSAIKPQPSPKSAVRKGTTTVALDQKSYVKMYGALARALDELARSHNLNNCPEHKKTIASLSDSMKHFESLFKLCKNVAAKRNGK